MLQVHIQRSEWIVGGDIGLHHRSADAFVWIQVHLQQAVLPTVGRLDVRMGLGGGVGHHSATTMARAPHSQTRVIPHLPISRLVPEIG